MSQFAYNTLLGGTCFFVGVLVGIFSTVWASIVGDKSQSNTQPRPRIIQHGESQLRDHPDFAALKLRRETGDFDAAEFEKWQANLRRAGKVK